MAKEKKILVAPLNWGLGHATRCIPIIRELERQGAQVVLAAEEHPRALLEQEFPHLPFIELPGYSITYPSGGNMAVHMIKLMPKILNGIKKEGERLKTQVEELGLDGVISDNRFGLHDVGVPTVFITHQVMIKSPYAESILQKLNRRYINKFDFCWIPDVVGSENLSGDLSHKYEPPSHARYVGPLSRFERMELPVEYEVLAIISGPEPQRTLFQHIVTTELEINNIRSLMVLGKAAQKMDYVDERIQFRSHLPAAELQRAVAASNIVVARSGYSTLMDLAAMGKKAILIPTPGQTEQEYLAEYHMNQKHYFTVDQDRFDLDEALDYTADYSGLYVPPQPELLSHTVKDFLAVC